jgi:LuxR family maltose regulon positive regulatory protein
MRLSGELTEIRAADLGFTVDEAGELMADASVPLDTGDLARLHERTEGWAAGLRLAAMSLARHDAPHRFVTEFSGSERTVAEYLMGEVLASQVPEVRDLLLRTCILERVNGPLADLLSGRSDGTRLLHELEEANAFVVALDVGRTWFRYHHLLADLLRLELRRTTPDEIATLHRRAAGWHADHGHAVEAIRHAQQGGDLELATELLGRHWVHIVLDGEESTLRALLAALPSRLAATDAEIATIAASAPRSTGSPKAAGRTPTSSSPRPNTHSPTLPTIGAAAPRPRSRPRSCTAPGGSATSTRWWTAPAPCFTPTTLSPLRSA